LLQKKGVVSTTTCEVCQAVDGTPEHITFCCTVACQFWNAVQITTNEDWSVQALREIQPPDHIPAKYFSTFLILCCWNIWKKAEQSGIQRRANELECNFGGL